MQGLLGKYMLILSFRRVASRSMLVLFWMGGRVLKVGRFCAISPIYSLSIAIVRQTRLGQKSLMSVIALFCGTCPFRKISSPMRREPLEILLGIML